jgi:predicted nuclease of predicted toxin-antitoxin system
MTLDEFKSAFVKNELGISDDYGKIATMIDFGNVNHWFEEDRQDSENKGLADDEKLVIDLQGLNDFSAIFSGDIRFYYGHDPVSQGSVGFITAAKHVFGRNRVFTKPIQYVRHHLKESEIDTNTRALFTDKEGCFVKIPKCNFDVEISVDAIRRIDSYDTLVLFSGDADFVALARYIRKKGKKIILIKGGNITTTLRNEVDLVVNVQKIKKHLTLIEKNGVKQKPGS